MKRNRIMPWTNMTSVIAIAAAVVSVQSAQAAAPTPSSWDIQQTFTPGAPASLTSPWESRAASGTNCATDIGPLTQAWSGFGGSAPGVSATTQPSPGNFLPLTFKALAPTSTSGVTIATGQVGMHPGSNCAVIRFKAPVAGVYKINGEFFSTQGPANHPADVRAYILDKGIQVPGGTGLVSKPQNAPNWSWPAANSFQLQAGETITFAVDRGPTGTYWADTVLIAGRVTWVDDLPAASNVFRASKFDFEGRQGCAIEQGTNKTFCWGENSAMQLGNATSSASNVAVHATRVDGFLAANPGVGAIARLEVGTDNVCAVTTTKNVLCWGSNGSLQSGLASVAVITTANSGPFAVRDITAPLGLFTKLTIHERTGCLTTTTGNVRCWGNNQLNSPANGGYLGWANGTGYPPSHVPMPNVPNVPGATDVAPGGGFSCAITGPAARVVCWGNMPWGASLLGGGPTPALMSHPDNIAQTFVKTYVSATQTPDLMQVTKIEVDVVRGCALKAGGALFCWGLNSGTNGALVGAPTPPGPSVLAYATPIPGPFSSGVTDFSMSGQGICAVKGGQVYCLGKNNEGQLGKPLATGGDWRTPIAAYATQPGVTYDVAPIPNLTGVQRIRGGASGFCALKNTGAIVCWGRGAEGQLGNGTSGTGVMSVVPVEVVK